MGTIQSVWLPELGGLPQLFFSKTIIAYPARQRRLCIGGSDKEWSMFPPVCVRLNTLESTFTQQTKHYTVFTKESIALFKSIFMMAERMLIPISDLLKHSFKLISQPSVDREYVNYT